MLSADVSPVPGAHNPPAGGGNHSTARLRAWPQHRGPSRGQGQEQTALGRGSKSRSRDSARLQERGTSAAALWLGFLQADFLI